MTQADDIRYLKQQVEDLRKEVQDVRRAQSWFTGALVGSGAILGFFASWIRTRLGLS